MDLSEDLKKELKEIAKSIKEEVVEAAKKDLGFDGMLEKLNEISDNLSKRDKALIKKVYVGEDLQKPVSELTAEEKVKAFAIALFTGDEASIKVLSEGTDADGGYLVPQDFYRQLVVEMAEENQLRGEVFVVPMKGKTLTIPKLDHGPDTYWTAEGATKSTTTADFSQPSITAYKLASIIYMTDELMDDAAFSLTEILVKLFAEKIAEKEETAIVAGTGSGQPTGLVVAGTISTVTCSGNLDFDDIIDLIYALPKKYRKKAKFLVHNNNVRELRKIKDSDGKYIWSDPTQPGMLPTLYGYPVLETYDIGEDKILFGDLKTTYWLGDRQRMTVKVTNDTETTFTKDETAIRVVERVGGTVVVPNASRILTTIP